LRIFPLTGEDTEMFVWVDLVVTHPKCLPKEKSAFQDSKAPKIEVLKD
jgi:hypothetical protein